MKLLASLALAITMVIAILSPTILANASSFYAPTRYARTPSYNKAYLQVAAIWDNEWSSGWTYMYRIDSFLNVVTTNYHFTCGYIGYVWGGYQSGRIVERYSDYYNTPWLRVETAWGWGFNDLKPEIGFGDQGNLMGCSYWHISGGMSQQAIIPRNSSTGYEYDYAYWTTYP
jgi:hypothetical protein